MAQTRYGYSTPRGIPGGLVDLSDYVVDARCNEAESGKVKYGLGVVTGSNPGSNIVLPTFASKAADFEGIAFSPMGVTRDISQLRTMPKPHQNSP